MANKEHVNILKKGVRIWNKWRKEHPGMKPDLSNVDLSGADLSHAYLRYANFSGANLSGANLSHASFNGANFSGANLGGTNFSNADLSHANLSGANLSFADLSHVKLGCADLSNAKLTSANLGRANLSFAILNRANLGRAYLSLADLSHANLSGFDLSIANLSGANLSNANLSDGILSSANLSGARVGRTIFGNLDLRTVQGLETLKHLGPSTIGTDTILRSEGDIPESFLWGAGLDDTFVSYVLSLARKLIQYYTCFISYSSKDQEFAQRLYNDLQGNNVRCWYAPEDLKIGDKFRIRIDESIRLYDKLLLILSGHSVRSPWVEKEVETAFEKEHKSDKLVLFPVKLDNTVMETEQAWASDIRRMRHIGDFTRWKEHDEYQKGLSRLLRDLKQEARHDTIESNANKD